MDKEAIATALRQIVRPHGFPPGKPAFPIQRQDSPLSSLVGPNSWLLFHLLGTNGHWLAQPPNLWDANPEYQMMATIVQHLEVVNDAAERGVKDTQDFANAARDGIQRGRIVLVSSSHRIRIPSFSKNEMEENL